MKTERLTFDAETHTYRLNGKVVSSVTQLLESEIIPPFDAKEIAARVARKRGRTPEYWIAEWERIGKEATDNGTVLHEHIERTILKQETVATTHETREFDRFWARAGVSLQPGHIEHRMGCEKYQLAGTCDALLLSRKSNKYHVFDWKTGKKFDTRNDWGRKLLPPFDDLDDCKLNIYSLQIAIYRLMIREEMGINTGPCFIGYFPPNGDHQVHKAIDYTDRVQAWLEDRTKKLTDSPGIR